MAWSACSGLLYCGQHRKYPHQGHSGSSNRAAEAAPRWVKHLSPARAADPATTCSSPSSSALPPARSWAATASPSRSRSSGTSANLESVLNLRGHRQDAHPRARRILTGESAFADDCCAEPGAPEEGTWPPRSRSSDRLTALRHPGLLAGDRERDEPPGRGALGRGQQRVDVPQSVSFVVLDVHVGRF